MREKSDGFPRANFEQKWNAWARRYNLLALRVFRLQQLEAELIKIADRLTRDDIADKQTALTVRCKIADGFGEAQAEIPSDALHYHLLANIERFQEETERTIRIDERILARHRS